MKDIILEEQTTTFPTLQGHQYMNLITFRRNGQPVTTPVWFVQEGAHLYFMTVRTSGKVKRIRNSNRVQVGPANQRGKSLGPTVEATARILSAQEEQHANTLLNQKYGLAKYAFDAAAKVMQFFRGPSERVYLEIAPLVD
ncbi:MAG: PPOX class F420-dependent oxidoreductase [Chloroflexi bacterium AL-W]|nr:PPOX class F420-dependent oxidoreductase [Chloroflexi bacterium AL-N1]NOK70946.1 PPOX class F420-dependent oxidoreductase [Chloroflexi bacterium AL-N10]NOK73219.1 PPOX class F420-dependent oxidoreductase [Chloroflexi bacterium AL-N5]NOK80116.1 PPOX class F420-dependent oxidoreductase [Chloroflexi bacterium AL-W]NOK88029.1 PPOX class F420-dependent oxidoreductase [Chloroflexi bacterium AL-N15]